MKPDYIENGLKATIIMLLSALLSAVFHPLLVIPGIIIAPYIIYCLIKDILREYTK